MSNDNQVNQDLVLKTTYNPNNGDSSSKVVKKVQLTDGERKLLDEANLGNAILNDLDRQWLALATKPFSEELKEKSEFIKKAVMTELNFTEDDQLLPLGLRHHLAQLAGHRFNYLDMFEEDIMYMEESTLRERLKWFNMLAALDYIVIYHLSGNSGCIEKMVQPPL